MAAATGPVIVTRPAAPGRRLADTLRGRGHEAAWWPAFEIVPPADPSRVDATLARLHDYDLAVFVSPNAVQAVAERLAIDWPAATVIGAVGAATRDAALAALRGAARATIVAPDDADESGSEGFWRAWRASGRRAQRVLLLRAASGRDWIIDQLHAAGAAVDPLPVYERVGQRLPASECERLRGWIEAGASPVVVVSSAEAVAAILDQVQAVDGAADWLRRCRAIATHPRVAQRLHEAGFTRVEVSDPADSAVIGKLESFAR